MAATDRLLREMKASPPKAGVLIVLTAVGMYFWIPPVWHAITRADESPAAYSSDELLADTTRDSEPVAASPSTRRPGWQELELVRKSDSLFQTASPSEIKADAFGMTQAPPSDTAETVQNPDVQETEDPAAFVEPSDEERRQAAQLEIAAVAQQLNLQSTMIGRSRRAAVINDRVYSEGDQLIVAGHRVRVQSVEPRRVHVDVNGESVALRIDPFGSSQIRLER